MPTFYCEENCKDVCEDMKQLLKNCAVISPCQPASHQTENAEASGLSALLNGINPFVQPDYKLLNRNGQRLLHACLCAYAKHSLNSEEVGWDELSDTLTSAICETIGDENFEEWLNSI